jgi:hypothetical protein
MEGFVKVRETPQGEEHKGKNNSEQWKSNAKNNGPNTINICNIEVDTTIFGSRAEPQNEANPADVSVCAVLSADSPRP